MYNANGRFRNPIFNEIPMNQSTAKNKRQKRSPKREKSYDIG
jgi:hypothetical protein